jgi:hypothetical protein
MAHHPRAADQRRQPPTHLNSSTSHCADSDIALQVLPEEEPAQQADPDDHGGRYQQAVIVSPLGEYRPFSYSCHQLFIVPHDPG